MSQTTDNSDKTPLRKEDLIQFTGSETWYRHPLFRQFLYTDGAQYVAEKVPFTDFPLKTIRFYFQNKTLFLPSEY